MVIFANSNSNGTIEAGVEPEGNEILAERNYDLFGLIIDDNRMRTDGRWLHTHYDSYGRATATGFINQGGMIDGSIFYSLSDSLSRTWYDGQGLNVTDPI